MNYTFTIHEMQNGEFAAVFKKTVYTADEEYSRLKMECKTFSSFRDALNKFIEFYEDGNIDIPFT